MSRTQRVALAIGAVVVLVVAFVIVQSGGNGDKSSTTAGTTATEPAAPAAGGAQQSTTDTTAAQPAEQKFRVVGAKPAGGIQTIKVNKGDTVRFAVISDVADEIHIHGYNLMKDVKKGGTVHFAFKATIDGIFVVELESRATQIGKLVVEP
jgi:FtsP/CotA-like multicopper oxidase with cupredoxin domain